eukprot:gene10033-biopygen15298
MPYTAPPFPRAAAAPWADEHIPGGNGSASGTHPAPPFLQILSCGTRPQPLLTQNSDDVDAGELWLGAARTWAGHRGAATLMSTSIRIGWGVPSRIFSGHIVEVRTQ